MRGAHQVEPLLDIEVVLDGGGDGVLGQHVQGVAGHGQRLDPAGDGFADGDGGAHHVRSVQRVDDAVGDGTDVVPGPADALQGGGDGERGLHLDHQVHRPHVDPQLQGAGGHHAAQCAGLELLLDLLAMLLGHGAVVGSRHVLQLRAVGPGLRVLALSTALAVRIPRCAAAVQQVELAGEPLGLSPGVGEHDGGAVCQHFLQHRPLHVRPDGAGDVVLVHRIGRRLDRREIRDGQLHREVPALLGGRAHHRHLPGPAVPGQECSDFIGRLHRGRQPDPLHGLHGERVQPGQGQRQVHAALGAGHGMHLVHDHRAHRAQGLPGLGGQHQEQRFRGGDQHVRGVGDEAPALGWRRVTGAHPHLDPAVRMSQHLRGSHGADQRGGEVPLHVHAQSLEGGDVQDARAGRIVCVIPSAEGEVVDGGQERGEGLAGARRRHHQRVLPGRHGPPGALLRGGGGAEGLAEPAGRGRAEQIQRTGRRPLCCLLPWCHRPIVDRGWDTRSTSQNAIPEGLPRERLDPAR